MSATLVLLIVGIYFLLLIAISRFSGKSDENDTFFTGNRRSPWYIVAFGMVGASLSGVTFISVPGWVESSQFSYLQVVLGYTLGYFVIIKVLLPLYYKLNLTSIYAYLEARFGFYSYKTGAFYFLLSRVIGASFRLYLVAIVLQWSVFDDLGIPFWLTVLLTIAMIWVYTFRSGIKTIIWTDTLQTAFMLIALGMAIFLLKDSIPQMELGFLNYFQESSHTQIFFWDDWKSDHFFFKQFLSGAFITIVMTGLDQDMMQKNLSCKSLKEAQKNMMWLAVILVVVNFLFLFLGAFLTDYAILNGIEAKADQLFPSIALSGNFGLALGIFFIIGLIAAAYSSADSALTALTTSFCIDFLGIEKKEGSTKNLRKLVHLSFSVVLLLVILIFKYTIDASVIKELFVAAGYTYGPLLGLYAFGLFTKLKLIDKWVPLIAVIAPVLSYILKDNSEAWFGYSFGFELLIVNGLLTFLGLLLIVNKKAS